MAFGKTGIDWRTTLAAVWRSNRHFLKPIIDVDFVDPDVLLGIDEQKERLFKNTENFLQNKACCHALLWGARGAGKSSLIKALLSRYHRVGLRIIQLPKDDLHLLVDIIDDIHDHSHKFIVYCDDLTFDEGENQYRQLKSTMEGTIEKPPANVLIYATSNRRHLMPEKMSDNLAIEQNDGGIRPGDAVEERLSLADRFGLSLCFTPMSEETYLSIVDHMFRNYKVDREELHEEALSFATQRGDRSGRTARHLLSHYQMRLQP